MGVIRLHSQIEPNWPLPYSTVPVPWLRHARQAGWATYCSICASTLPRAQNRAGKGSIILWRRFTFPLFLLFIYDYPGQCIGDFSQCVIYIFKQDRTFQSRSILNTILVHTCVVYINYIYNKKCVKVLNSFTSHKVQSLENRFLI